MVSLPPISAHIFDTQIQAQAPSVTPTIIPVLGEESDSSHTSDSDLSIESYPEELTSSPVGSSLCIFCDLDFQTSEDSISHMQHMHGLHIPNSTYSTDLETFIEYLRTLVLQYHECLYCGHVKRSAQGIRQHMMSKGHCMIDLSPGSNLLEFWDFPEGEAMGSRSEVDAVERSAASLLKVPRLHGSGEVRRRQRISTRRPRKAVAADGSNDASQERQTHPRASRDRQVAARGESGMLGVSDQQKRALRAVEKTFLKQEVVARAHQRWAVEKVANRQKNFKVCLLSQYNISRDVFADLFIVRCSGQEERLRV